MSELGYLHFKDITANCAGNTHIESSVGHLQQEGNLGFLIEPLLVSSQPPQDVFVEGEVIAGSSYVVESGAVPAPTVQTGAGGRAEVSRV